MTNQLGISLRETEDELIRDMLLSSAGQINCVGGVNGDNPTEFTASDIAGAGATLFNANAYTIADKIEGQNKFGTSPVRNSYFAMGNSNLTQSLDNVDGFIHSSQYPSQMNILESEWGSVKNVRFLLSSIGSTSPNDSFLGNTVYNTFIAGMESYGFVRQDRESAHFIYLPPEIAGGNLALNASLGWKTRNAQEILYTGFYCDQDQTSFSF